MVARKEVTFVIRARDLTRGVFNRISRSIRGLRLGLGSLVAGVGLTAITRNVLDFATSIQATSQRINISAESLQRWNQLAEDSGVSSETFATVLQRIQTNAGRALNQNIQLADAFREIGIGLDDLSALNADQLFLRIADAAQAAGSDRRFQALLAQIADTEGVRLLPLLRQGAAELIRQREEITVQSNEQIRTLAETEAEARRVLLSANVRIAQLLLQVLPSLARLVERLLANAERVGAAAGGAVGRVSRADTDLARVAGSRLPTEEPSQELRFGGPLGGGLAGGAILELIRGGVEALRSIDKNTNGGPRLRQ